MKGIIGLTSGADPTYVVLPRCHAPVLGCMEMQHITYVVSTYPQYSGLRCSTGQLILSLFIPQDEYILEHSRYAGSSQHGHVELHAV